MNNHICYYVFSYLVYIHLVYNLNKNNMFNENYKNLPIKVYTKNFLNI